jgi:hypothetical protein
MHQKRRQCYQNGSFAHSRMDSPRVTTYRLFPTTNGPSTAVSYTGTFQAGILFEVTEGGCWFEGYWWWVCNTGQPTSPQKFALWNITGEAEATLVPASVVTSGKLAAGQWNYIPIPTPIPLAIGTAYDACTGFTGGFPDTNNSFGASPDPYSAGITNGPLMAYSGSAGTNPPPYTNENAVFGTGSDPSAAPPFGQDSSYDNFWMDLQVSNTAPAGYSGSWRLWPTKTDSDPYTSGDSEVNYVVGTEIHLTQACALDNIWYYSPGGTTQLATACDVWSIATQQAIASSTSPSWSGAAGSGWVACPFTGMTLPAGSYRVSIYNGAASPDSWSPKRLGYWGVYKGAPAPGGNGITTGPLYAPQTATASMASEFESSGQEPGQSIFAVGPPNQYPDLYVDGLFQNYWVDMEVTPASATSSPEPPPTVTTTPPSTPEPPANSRTFLTFFP